VIVEDCL